MPSTMLRTLTSALTSALTSTLACLLAALPGAAGAGVDHIDGELGLALAAHGPAGDADGHRMGERRLLLRLDAQGRLGELDWRAEGRVRTDLRLLDDARGTRDAREAWRPDADWRQLWISHRIGGGEATLGWQQVVWGRADELRVLDRINPLDWRDGPTALLAESRIALPMLRYQRRLADWQLDALWLLRGEPDRAPARGSDWDAPAFAPPDPALFDLRAAPGGDRRHGGGAGLRMERTFGRIDTSLVALQSRRHQPAVSLVGVGEDGRLRLDARHPLDRMLGLGVAVDPGHALLLRAELAWLPAHAPAFAIAGTADGDAADQFASLLGVDYLWRSWMLSAQWQREQRRDAAAARSDLYTLSLDGSFAADRGSLRLAVATTPSPSSDWLLQARLGWRPSDRLRLGLQLDLLGGQPEGVFGQWRERDRLLLSLTHLF